MNLVAENEFIQIHYSFSFCLLALAYGVAVLFTYSSIVCFSDRD